MKRFVLLIIMAIMAMMMNPAMSSAQDTVLANSAITVTCTGIGGDLVIQNPANEAVWVAFVTSNGGQEVDDNRFSVSPTATNGPTTILGGTERLGEFLAVSVDQNSAATQWVRVECVAAEISVSCPVRDYLDGFVTVRGMWTDKGSVQTCFEVGDAGRSGITCGFPEETEAPKPSYVNESTYPLSSTIAQRVYAEFRIMDKTGLVVAKASETKVCEPAVVRSIDIGCETQIVEWASQSDHLVDVTFRTVVDGVTEDTTTLNGTSSTGTWVTPTPYDGTHDVTVEVFVYNDEGDLIGGLARTERLWCYNSTLFAPFANK